MRYYNFNYMMGSVLTTALSGRQSCEWLRHRRGEVDRDGGDVEMRDDRRVCGMRQAGEETD